LAFVIRWGLDGTLILLARSVVVRALLIERSVVRELVAGEFVALVIELASGIEKAIVGLARYPAATRSNQQRKKQDAHPLGISRAHGPRSLSGPPRASLSLRRFLGLGLNGTRS
jgi:hypothetical protein